MATQLVSKLPSRLHHNAFVVRDHEINRRFFEDVLGIPLVATWCEKNYSAEMQKEVEEALRRVSKEAENPEVRRVAVVHVKTIGAATEVNAALTIEPKEAG